ncbi:hypothetical protein JCM10207_006378 [Rhodosporidiobolus poonsookiae]
MLDQLPTELVEAILEHLAPPLSSLRDEAPSRSDLFSVMRVSKGLFILARPIFWRAVRINSAAQALRLLAFLRTVAALGTRQHVKTMQFTFATIDCITMTDLRSLCALLPRLRRFETIPFTGAVDLNVLAELGLRALWLREARLMPNPSPSHFRSLAELSLQDLELVQIAFAPFSPYRFPPRLRESHTPVVLKLHNDNLSSVFACAATHVAYFVSRPACLRYLDNIRSIFTPFYAPRVLHLSAILNPDYLPVDDIHPELMDLLPQTLEKTYEMCEERGVQVVWHAQDGGRSGAVSPSLWRWAKSMKAKELKDTV